MDRIEDGSFEPGFVVGVSPAMQKLLLQIRAMRSHQLPILIAGEFGTGKELVARYIHDSSGRRGPFVPVDCASLTPSLIETELFGHTKGAFTGATCESKGLFVAANGGTIFLDEIGELPLFLQAKLLRVLQEHEVRPVGGLRSVRVDFRVVAATNRDLLAMVHAGVFRQDLYFRLNVVQIRMPALRDRRGDIPLLAQYFMERHRAPGSEIQISDSAMQVLEVYAWPGNIRELENAILHALALCDEAENSTMAFPVF